MHYEEFKKFVFESIKECPKNWRKGQAVFNFIDSVFGVARMVQYKDGIDCFYNDDNIEPFLKTAYHNYLIK